jgi:hypothetical protein
MVSMETSGFVLGVVIGGAELESSPESVNAGLLRRLILFAEEGTGSLG